MLLPEVSVAAENHMVTLNGNDSMQHEDFMFGTREMSVDGIRKDGTVVPVFRNGNFVF